MKAVKFGLQTGQQNVTWKDLLELWPKAEDWGYDSLWCFDHFYPIFTDPSGPCLEGWTTLSALAVATKRIRIGHLVNGNTYRNPCLVAKMAATLDHISGGRLNLGIGAGWFEAEHGSLGFDFKTLGGRLEALGESCRIIKGMFSGEKTTFAGKHYAVEDALCVPPPIQEGGPPLLVAGSGRRVLLKIVAEYADMWNSTGNPEEIGELITTIGRHGDLLKRDCSAIEYTVMMPLVYTEDRERQDRLVAMFATVFGLSPEDSRARMMVGSKQQCLDKIAAYVDVGATHFIFMMTPPYPTEELGAFAEEVVPAAREIWPG